MSDVQIVKHFFCDVRPNLCPVLGTRLLVPGYVYRHEYVLDYTPVESSTMQESKETALHMYKDMKETEWQGFLEEAAENFGCEIALVDKNVDDYRIIGTNEVFCRRIVYFVPSEHTTKVRKSLKDGTKIQLADIGLVL